MIDQERALNKESLHVLKLQVQLQLHAPRDA